MKRSAHYLLQNFLLVTLTVSAFFLVTRATGLMQDDFWYQRQYVDRFDGEKFQNLSNFFNIHEDYITTWGQAFESCVNHYKFHDNGRMANNLRLLSNMIPEWSVDLLSALMLALLAGALLRLALPGRRFSPMGWGMTLLFIFLFPTWEHAMLCADFLMNYLWSGALVAAASVTIAHKPLRGGRLWMAFALCLFAGTMHEGFSVPALAGLAIWLLMHKGGSARRWMLWGAMAAGAAFVLFSPATFDRILFLNDAKHYEASARFVMVGHCLAEQSVGIVLCSLLWVWCFFRCRSRAMRFLVESFPLLAVIVVSITITVMTVAAERALWAAGLAFVILAVRLVFITLRRTVASYPLGWALTLAVCAWLGMLSTWQLQSTRNQEALVELYRSNPEARILYFDLVSAHSYPAISNDMITGAGIDVNELKSALGSVRGREITDSIAVLPERFRGIPLDSLPLVAGSAGLRGSYPFYYSERGRVDLGGSVIVDYGEPYSAPGSVPFSDNPLSRAAKRLRSFFSGYNSGQLAIWTTVIPVTDEMRRQGISDRDTVWFYCLSKLPPHARSREIKAINMAE